MSNYVESSRASAGRSLITNGSETQYPIGQVWTFEVKNTQLNAMVQAKRIEAVGPLQADVISARALADLNDLLRLTYPFMSQNTQCLFMKGKNWSKEVKEAEKSWQFQAERFISKTNHEAVILSVRNVTGAPRSE